jgi:hypothetical protein
MNLKHYGGKDFTVDDRKPKPHLLNLKLINVKKKIKNSSVHILRENPFSFFIDFYFWWYWPIEPRASYMLGKLLSLKLCPQPLLF